MENPQVENGYIQIATSIWENLGRYRLSGEEWLVLNFIIRKTYGWKKKEDYIALLQFHEYTGMKKPSIIRAIKKLLDKNIVSKKANDNGNSYSFNKLFSTWKPLAKKLTVSTLVNDVSQKANTSLAKKLPTIYTNTKETITKERGGILNLTTNQKETLRRKYPNADIDKLYDKFRAWQKANARSFPNVLEAFKVWLIEDNIKNKPSEVLHL